MFCYCDNKFSLKTVLLLVDQLIHRIRYLLAKFGQTRMHVGYAGIQDSAAKTETNRAQLFGVANKRYRAFSEVRLFVVDVCIKDSNNNNADGTQNISNFLSRGNSI